MDKAEQYGSGWVSVCNTNHFGIAGYYPLKALERDLIGWAMTNTTKLVAPLWGAERMLGTNPLAIAFPGYKEPPIVIDARMKPWYPKEVTCRPDIAELVTRRWTEYFRGPGVAMGDSERGHLD